MGSTIAAVHEYGTGGYPGVDWEVIFMGTTPANNLTPHGWTMLGNSATAPTAVAVSWPDPTPSGTHSAYIFVQTGTTTWAYYTGDFDVPFLPPAPVTQCIQGSHDAIIAAGYIINSGPYPSQAACEGNCP